MARRQMTLRRIDPWSVLKFGFVANICLLAIGLLGFGVLWFAIRQLGLIEQICNTAIDIGFTQCGVNGGNLFRLLLLFGVLGVVVQTGLFVFLAFLHNLITDLVGGIAISVYEEGPARSAGFSSRGTSRSGDRRRTGSGDDRAASEPSSTPPATTRATPAARPGGESTGRGQRPDGRTSSVPDSWRRTSDRSAESPSGSRSRSDENLFGDR